MEITCYAANTASTKTYILSLYSAYNAKRLYWGAVVASRKAFILYFSISLMANLYFQPYVGVKGIRVEDSRKFVHAIPVANLKLNFYCKPNVVQHNTCSASCVGGSIKAHLKVRWDEEDENNRDVLLETLQISGASRMHRSVLCLVTCKMNLCVELAFRGAEQFPKS